jgi:hypothetical protein
VRREEEEEEEEEEFFNHYKNDLERHAHTPSGVASADLKSQTGGALRTLRTQGRRRPGPACTYANLHRPGCPHDPPASQSRYIVCIIHSRAGSTCSCENDQSASGSPWSSPLASAAMAMIAKSLTHHEHCLVAGGKGHPRHCLVEA